MFVWGGFHWCPEFKLLGILYATVSSSSCFRGLASEHGGLQPGRVLVPAMTAIWAGSGCAHLRGGAKDLCLLCWKEPFSGSKQKHGSFCETIIVSWEQKFKGFRLLIFPIKEFGIVCIHQELSLSWLYIL